MRLFTFLSLLVYTNFGIALGLGDIALKSQLGERLLATVTVSDIDPQADANCFAVQDNSEPPAFKNTSLVLQANHDGYELTISSNEMVTEPIINLSLSFICQPSVRREYVLLLDLMPVNGIGQIPIKDTAPILAENVNSATNSVLSMPATLAHDPPNSANTAAVTRPKRLAIKKIHAATKVEDQLNAAYTGQHIGRIRAAAKTKNLVEQPSQVSQATSSNQPFLVISGDEANDLPALSLRLTKEIDVNRPAPVTMVSTETDSLDEATMMTNRLKHLEDQITRLQKRNLELIAESAEAKKIIWVSHWQQIFLTALLVIIGLTGITWLRRKLLTRRKKIAGPKWFDTEAIAALRENSAVGKKPAFADANFNVQLSERNIQSQAVQAASTENDLPKTSAVALPTFDLEQHPPSAPLEETQKDDLLESIDFTEIANNSASAATDEAEKIDLFASTAEVILPTFELEENAMSGTPQATIKKPD